MDEDRAIIQWMPAIRKEAYRLRRYGQLFGCELEDLQAAGMIGVVNACRSHDPSKGSFGTHVVNHIRFAVSHEIRRWRPYYGLARNSTQLPVNQDEVPVWLADKKSKTLFEDVELEAAIDAWHDLFSDRRRCMLKAVSAGHTIKEVSKMQHCSPQAARSSFSRMKPKLAELFADLLGAA